MFKFYFFVRNLYSRFGDYMAYIGPGGLKTFDKFFEFAVKWHRWEVTHGAGDKIPSLLEGVKNMEEEVAQAKKEANRERRMTELAEERYRKDIPRYEQEAIHLKELVQEKNMVIDKLLAQIKVPQRES